MGKSLSDPKEMEIIYKTSKDIFEGVKSEKKALNAIINSVNGTKSSLRMYVNIYRCMRQGKCYKMGTSEAYTKFLLVNIYKDSGKEAFDKALSAVMGNYKYRISVDNAQLGLKRACEEAINEVGERIDLLEVTAASFENEEDDNNRVDLLNNQNIINNKKEDYTVKIDEENSFELNIQPAASILNVFSRLSYKPWYAIAEFVDNSTQSYISHQEELNSDAFFDKLVVTVRYNSKENILSIVDNAYGMEIDRFKDAIILDSRNETQSGRNEFGMGLKTAASWFGNVWTVKSTQYGSKNYYTATVDIPKLKENHLNSIHIHRDFVDENLHGTEIIIEQVTKRITGSRTIGKIRDLLSSMYRRDINNRNIEVWFNGEPIVFENYPVLTNFRGKEWKKNLDFVVNFMEKEYRVTGFVAIMNPGSFPKAGFALFRQDRVVIGGTDVNYKPSAIFGQAQSQRSLKLFGELNMNDFPVNQAKDGFVWDDGLEDEFIDALKANIQEYLDIADLSKKQRDDESQYSDEKSEEVHKDVEQSLKNAFDAEYDNFEEQKENDQENIDEEDDENISDYQEYVNEYINAETEEKIVGTERNYVIPISPIEKLEFSVKWATGSKKYWIEYENIEDNKYDVIINIEHPFFMPFSKEETFKRVLEKFTLAFIISERQAKYISDYEGYIPANVIKNYMNKYLQKMAEE